MRRDVPILVLLGIAIFCLLSIPNYKTPLIIQFDAKDVDPRVTVPFHEWKRCLETNISTYRNDSNLLWWNLWKGVALCERLPFMGQLEILDFSNSDETKHHIPSLQQKPSIIVTLGVGHDTAAEEAVRKVLPTGSLFYGADPIHDVNEDLFNKFGTFFPFAVGAKSQISNADVLIDGSYVRRNVIYIDLVYFLTEIIGHKVYDDLWIDAEGAEYELFPYFYRDGKLDQHGITLCQFNMEVHWPNDAQKELFRKFILRILEDNRYAFFRPVQGRHIQATRDSIQQKPSIIVTLGVGHDTAAEEAVRKVLPTGSLFYGADPIHDVNEDLFNKFGTFFPFAVGAKSQISNADVLIDGSYVRRNVIYIDLVYFLTEIIGHKVYDDLWIDAEGAEYELFPYFYRDGKLDQHGITLCQFNMEVHWPNDAQKELFRKFILRILEDNRYAFFRPVQGRHIRLYFLNFSDSHCVSKYVFRKTS